MRAFMRYLFGVSPRDNLPHLHRDVWATYDVANIDPEIYLVMMSGVAPDPDTAHEMMQKYDAKTAGELIAKLPRRRLNLMAKLKALTLNLEGAYAADPHRTDYLKIKKLRQDNRL